MARDPSPTTPRWPTLGGLGAAVLGVHLWLLVGDLPLDLSTSAPAATSTQLTEQSPSTASAPMAAPAPVRPVTVSQVRWITAQAAPASPAQAKARPASSKKTASSEDSAPKNAPPEIAPSADNVMAGSTALPATPEPAAEPATAPLAQAPATQSLLSSTPSPAAPDQPLPPARVPASTQLAFDVSGTVRGLNYSAQGTLDWTVSNDRYDVRMSVRLPLIGSRVQTSTGRLGTSGLLPERFSDKASRERAAHFEHEQQRIRFSSNAPEAALQPGAQDRLSVFLQLAARFNAAPPPAGQVIDIQVAGTGDADVWRFVVGEEVTLKLPAGDMRTRRLVREAPGPRDTQVELWLAPALDHLPVRIRLEQSSGDQVDQQLSRMP